MKHVEIAFICFLPKLWRKNLTDAWNTTSTLCTFFAENRIPGCSISSFCCPYWASWFRSFWKRWSAACHRRYWNSIRRSQVLLRLEARSVLCFSVNLQIWIFWFKKVFCHASFQSKVVLLLVRIFKLLSRISLDFIHLYIVQKCRCWNFKSFRMLCLLGCRCFPPADLGPVEIFQDSFQPISMFFCSILIQDLLCLVLFGISIDYIVEKPLQRFHIQSFACVAVFL